MLIYLTDSLITKDDAKKRADVEKCIRNLCIAYEESKHVLRGDYKVLEWGKTIVTDKSGKMVLNKLANEYATSAIPDDITEYVKVGAWEKKTVVETGQQTIHQVPYLFFIDTGNCQKTAVIAEDKNDIDLYRYILKWYIGSKKYNFDFTSRYGGGVNTDKTMEVVLQDSVIAIAIIDTDMRFDGDKIKKDSTCDRCKKVYNEVANRTVCKLHVLSVHEIENILPLDMVIGFDWNKENLTHFQKLVELDKNGDILRYFDIKKGINIDDLKDENCKKFAEYCYSNNLTLTTNCTFTEKIAKVEEELRKDKDANKIIYPGLGNPLKKTIEHLKERTDFSLKPFQEEEWKLIGADLLNYCIARPKEASN